MKIKINKSIRLFDRTRTIGEVLEMEDTKLAKELISRGAVEAVEEEEEPAEDESTANGGEDKPAKQPAKGGKK